MFFDQTEEVKSLKELEVSENSCFHFMSSCELHHQLQSEYDVNQQASVSNIPLVASFHPHKLLYPL